MSRWGTLGGVLGVVLLSLGFTQMGPCPFFNRPPPPCATNANCATGLVCNTASGACVECLGAGDCNDENACTTDSCVDSACVLAAIAGCCDADADCTAPNICDLTTHACVTPGPRVTIAGCPATANQGDTVNLTSTISGFTAGGTQVFAWTSTGATFVPANAANTAATLTASGSVTLTVTVTNTIDGGTGVDPADPADDPADTVQTANDTCTVPVAFSAQLTVDAGGLVSDRASSSFYFSGTPGTAGNNALNGSANQQGVPSNAIATVWTSTSKPAGSGAVTFSNAALLATAFNIGPPALPGAYVFTLTATNENTAETNSDTVTLSLLVEPLVRVADGQAPMRIVMLRGTTTPADVALLYTAESDAVIEIFDGTTGLFDAPVPADLISALSVPAGANAAATGKIDAIGFRETNNPDLYDLTSRISDSVDVEPGDASGADQGELENPNPTPDRASLNELLLFTTDSWVESASTLTPPVIDLQSEVGEVDGGGDIIHQGIGSDDGFQPMRDTDNGADRVKVGDINEDGFDDLIVNDDDIKIYFGAPDIVTDLGDAGGFVGWNDTPDVTIDGGDDFEDFCVGDVNGDGHLDIVTVTDTGTTFVEVWLLDGADSVDLGNADASRTYTADDDANLDLNVFVLCGDVGTGAGASGVADIIAVSSGYDDDAAAAASNDGAVFVIYGRNSLPADDSIEDDSVTGLTGSNQNGERIFDNNSGAFPADNNDDQFGTLAALGQWDSSGLDLVIGEGAGTAEVRIYLGGGSRINRNPARVYTAADSGDLLDGDAILADVTGDGRSELIVLSPDKDTVYIVPNGLANTGLNSAQVFIYDVAAFPLPLFGGGTSAGFLDIGDQVAAGDLDGDGVNELLIGNFDDSRVIAIKGPITSNIEGPNDVFRIYEDDDGDDFGEVILFGDVTGDSLTDFLLGSTFDDNLAILQGFFTTTTP